MYSSESECIPMNIYIYCIYLRIAHHDAISWRCNVQRYIYLHIPIYIYPYISTYESPIMMQFHHNTMYTDRYIYLYLYTSIYILYLPTNRPSWCNLIAIRCICITRSLYIYTYLSIYIHLRIAHHNEISLRCNAQR